MNIEILMIAILTSIACSVVGVILVLRKMSMMSDAISHTVLLGIVLAFFIVPDLSSPFLIVGATLMGLVTVYLVEVLVKTKKTNEGAATGVVFTLLFSIAIVLISTQFRDTHLDVDAVLLGNLEFAIFQRVSLFGVDIGARLIYLMLIICVIVISVITLFYKEIKIIIFDPALALTLGFSVTIIHYLVMTLVSLTAVAAFDAVGSILVVALMIGPAITALLVSKNLAQTFVYAAMIGIINAVIGYFLALSLDINTSGAIASITLVVFLISLLFAPKKGLIANYIRKKGQRKDFHLLNLVYHVYSHQHDEKLRKEISLTTMNLELKWSVVRLKNILIYAKRKKLILKNGDKLELSKAGLQFIKRNKSKID